MKKMMMTLTGRILLLTGALSVALIPTCLHATPYASGVTNNNGLVQFYLNESGGTVKVLFDNNTSSLNLGLLPSGSNAFNLGTHSNYSIVVSKTGSGTWSQISVNTTNNSFYGPRGVAVNRNPQRPNFGRVYVCNASAGVGDVAPVQTVGRGIYILNADTSDALGRYSTPSLGGMTLGSSGTGSPYKIFVGPDDMVYVGDYTGFYTGTPGSGAVTMFDPAITVQTPVLNWTNNPSHTSASTFSGCISTPFVTGSLAAGNLQLWCNEWGMEDSAGNYTDIYGYNVGGTLPCTSFPSTNAPIGPVGIKTVDGITGDLYIATNGYFFCSQDRSSGTNNISLFVYASDAQTYLWDSYTAAGGNINVGTALPPYDPFSSTYGVAVSPDDQYVACVNGATGYVLLAKLTNGIPDLSTVTTNVTSLGGGTARGIAWDLADNVYETSGGNDRLAAFSLGLTTTATTYNDKTSTNGTFTLVLPPTSITVVAITNQASQNGMLGAFQITRAGQNINLPLTITFILGGTAGDIYTCLPAGITPAATNTITFAANQLSTNITIIPNNDGIPRPTTTVVLSLVSGTNYSTSVPNTDTVNIQNNGPEFIFVSSVTEPTMYNAFANDFAQFTVTRWGDTNNSGSSVTVTFASVGGTAIINTDYTAPGSITFNPGDLVYSNYISPLTGGQPPVASSTNPYVGNKTAIIAVAPGGGYTTSASSNALLTILDSANPPVPVLWANPLTDPNDATNWGITYANNNMQTNNIDYTVNFGYTLGTSAGDPPPGPSGAANVLRVTVNKVGTSGATPAGAAAGVNLYPTNMNFGGNYAVRFDMNLIQGYITSVTTEGALFGINHNGMMTNWWSGSGVLSYWGAAPGDAAGWGADGVWYYINADYGTEEYLEKTGVGGSLPNSGWQQPNAYYVSQFYDVFNTDIFTGGVVAGGPGLVSNGSLFNTPGDANNWANVEIKQINNVVTMSIDKTPVFVYTNTTSFTNGTLMLGYDDPFSSIGGSDAAAYYSNLRVVSLASFTITHMAVNKVSGTAVIDFTSANGGSPSSFVLQSSAAVNGPYTTAAGATITEPSPDVFEAVVPQSGAMQFYRILEP